jgi:glycosyltransferase involved in cell wall biosynthesis
MLRADFETLTTASMNPRIRIAHINVARDYRGGERQTELLIRELIKHDVDQVLVARRNEPLAQRLADLDIEIRLTSRGDPFTACAATRGVDLVHVHEGRSVYAAYLRALISGTPYILMRHVNNPIGDHWFAHRAYRRAASVCAVAPAIADIVKNFDAATRIRVILPSSSNLPVDKAVSNAIRQRFEGKFLVGHVAALDNAQKGQEYILAVAKELVHTDPDVSFILLGRGPDEKMLKSMAEGLRNVEFEGFVDNVGDYLAAFDLLILPSNREGIGSILLDAMDQRLAIVAAGVAGVPTLVRDGDNGLLIEPRRPDQLKQAILRLRAEPDLRRALGNRGFAFAQDFSATAMGNRYVDLYREILSCSQI